MYIYIYTCYIYIYHPEVDRILDVQKYSQLCDDVFKYPYSIYFRIIIYIICICGGFLQ